MHETAAKKAFHKLISMPVLDYITLVSYKNIHNTCSYVILKTRFVCFVCLCVCDIDVFRTQGVSRQAVFTEKRS